MITILQWIGFIQAVQREMILSEFLMNDEEYTIMKESDVNKIGDSHEKGSANTIYDNVGSRSWSLFCMG